MTFACCLLPVASCRIEKFLKLPLLIFLLSVSACQRQTDSGDKLGKLEQDTKDVSKLESRLILNNATLEQSNAKGQTLWKIKVETANYSPDKKTAQLEKITGNLFQDGKIVLKVSANKGEVQKDAEEILLKENIIATDPRNGAVIQSEELKWQPKQDLVIIRKNLTGKHPKLEVLAKEGQYYSRKQRLELIGDIVATAKDPRLQMKAQYMFWEIPQDKVVADKPNKTDKSSIAYRPPQIVRYQDKTITDQVVANRAEVDLKAKTAILKENIDFKSLKPALQMAANSIIWYYKNRLVKTDQPIQLVNHQDQLTITGNQAEVDLNQKVAYLKGGTQGTNNRNPAKLYANELIWRMPTQIVEATGNVIYEQTKPKFNLTGDKAVGILKDNNIVVTSNNRDRVVTEIFP